MLWKALERVTDFACLESENLKLFGIDDELKLRALEDESVKQASALLDEAVFLVSENLFFGDARNKATGPALVQSHVQDVELVVATDDLPTTTLLVQARDRVLDNGANLLRVGHGESMSGGIGSLKRLLTSNAGGLTYLVELVDLVHQLRLCLASHIVKSLVGFVVLCLCRCGTVRLNWLLRTGVGIVLFLLLLLFVLAGVVFFFLLSWLFLLEGAAFISWLSRLLSLNHGLSLGGLGLIFLVRAFVVEQF